MSANADLLVRALRDHCAQCMDTNAFHMEAVSLPPVWADMFVSAQQMPDGKTLAYRSEAPAMAAEGMEDEVQLLLGPVWHKSVHKVAGCAHSAAWPQEGVTVHAVVACKPCNNLSGRPARICCATGQ